MLTEEIFYRIMLEIERGLIHCMCLKIALRRLLALGTGQQSLDLFEWDPVFRVAGVTSVF